MDRYAAEFLSSGYLSPKQHELLRSQGKCSPQCFASSLTASFVVDELLAAMRPQAVPIVDGFACPDYLLNSALGRYDGDVYRQAG
jgi:acyl-CoA oxidase